MKSVEVVQGVGSQVFMVDAASQEVCDGLLAAVWVIRKAGAGLDAEVVEHQEGGEVAQLRRAYGSSYARTCALGLLDGQEDLANRSGDGRRRHVGVGLWCNWVCRRFDLFLCRCARIYNFRAVSFVVAQCLYGSSCEFKDLFSKYDDREDCDKDGDGD